MNRTQKFHSPIGPAFTPGEEWQSYSGNIKCWIVETRKYGPNKWDVEVTYRFVDNSYSSKDAWNFQVRYFPSADLFIK